MECDEGDICGKHQMEKGSRAQTVVNQMAQRPIELRLAKMSSRSWGIFYA